MAGVFVKRRAFQLSSQFRQFSSSPARNAAEVKRLGVIGAGQMVSRHVILTLLISGRLLTTFL